MTDFRQPLFRFIINPSIVLILAIGNIDSATSSENEAGAWKAIEGMSGTSQEISGTEKRRFMLNTERFMRSVADADTVPKTVWFPTPDGQYAPFVIQDSGTMNPALKLKYPSIRTFKGYRADDPNSTIRFEIGPLGISAEISSDAESYYIIPGDYEGEYHITQ